MASPVGDGGKVSLTPTLQRHQQPAQRRQSSARRHLLVALETYRGGVLVVLRPIGATVARHSRRLLERRSLSWHLGLSSTVHPRARPEMGRLRRAAVAATACTTTAFHVRQHQQALIKRHLYVKGSGYVEGRGQHRQISGPARSGRAHGPGARDGARQRPARGFTVANIGRRAEGPSDLFHLRPWGASRSRWFVDDDEDEKSINRGRRSSRRRRRRSTSRCPSRRRGSAFADDASTWRTRL